MLNEHSFNMAIADQRQSRTRSWRAASCRALTACGLIALAGAGCSAGEESLAGDGTPAANPRNDSPEGADKQDCNAAGAFLRVRLSGALDGAVEPSEPVTCASIGDGTSEVRGLTVIRRFDDGGQWSFDVTGDFTVGALDEDVPVEVFVIADDGAKSESWFGDCRINITTFEPDAPFAGSERYLFGGPITCAAPLERFLPGDGELTLSDFELVGMLAGD